MVGSLRFMWKRTYVYALKWMIFPSLMYTLITFFMYIYIFMFTPVMLATSAKEKVFDMDDSWMWIFIGNRIRSPILSKDIFLPLVNINNFSSGLQFLIYFTKYAFYNTRQRESFQEYPIGINCLIILDLLLW